MRLLKPRMLSHFSRFISSGDLVFDIGANVGDLAEIFLILGARVVCVEPQPYCISVLKKKFAGEKRVTIVEKGLNSQKGNLPFYISSEDHPTSTFTKKMSTSGRYRSRLWDERITVPVTTTEALIDRFGRPAFCKIDVEGFESRVLQGLHSPVPALSFEFHREFLSDAKASAQQLTSLGDVKFNYSLYIMYSLDSDPWLTYDELFEKLKSKSERLRHRYMNGDIYARFY